jgi:Ca2+/Na+ antiporter
VKNKIIAAVLLVLTVTCWILADQLVPPFTWVYFSLWVLGIFFYACTLIHVMIIGAESRDKEETDKEDLIIALKTEITQLKEEKRVRLRLDTAYRWSREHQVSTEKMMDAMMSHGGLSYEEVLRYLREYQGYNAPPRASGPITVVKRDINEGDRI